MSEANFDSAALLSKYIGLRTAGGIDDLAPHTVLSLPKTGASEPQVLAALRDKLSLVQRVPATSDAEVSHVRMLLHASAAVMLAQNLGSETADIDHAPASQSADRLANASPTQQASTRGSANTSALSHNLASDLGPTTWSAMPATRQRQEELIDLAAPEVPLHDVDRQSAAARRDAQLDRFALAASPHTSSSSPNDRLRASQAPLRERATAERSTLEQELFVTLAMCGGWNARSMQRVQLLAASRGLAPTELVATLHRAMQLATGEAPLSPRATGRVSQPMSQPVSQPATMPASASVSRPQATTRALEAQSAAHASSTQSARNEASGVRASIGHAPRDEAESLPQNAQTVDAEFDPSSQHADAVASKLKMMFVGGATGAVLLLVVALTLRYTIGRTPAAAPATTPTPGTPSATNAGITAANATGSNDATSLRSAPDAISASASQANTSPSVPQNTTQAGGNRSVQELLAALQAAAAQGGVQRVPASLSQSAPAADDVAPQSLPKAPPRDLDGSLIRFREAIEELGERWVAASEQQLPAISNAALEYLYRVGDSDVHAQGAIAVLAEPARLLFAQDASALLTPQQLRAGVLSAGLLARMRGERDLSWSMRTAIERASDAVFAATGAPAAGENSTLAQGAATALRALPARLLAQPRTATIDASPLWQAWRECASAATTARSDPHTQLTLAAVESLLASPLAPAQHPVVLAGYRSLIPSLPWGEAASASTGAKPHEMTQSAGGTSTNPQQLLLRERLLAWLASTSIGADHLSVVIAAMIDGKVPGVDLSMALSASANETDRAALRERFASLWGLQGADAIASDATSDAIGRWREVIQPLRQPLAADADRSAMMIRLVSTAYTNTIAWQLVLGDTSAAKTALDINGGTGVPASATQRPYVFQLLSLPAPEGWSVRYLAAGSNANKRLEALREANTITSLLDARIALDESMRGALPELRSKARQLVEAHVDSQFVLAAALDTTASAPPVAELRSLYERLAGGKLPTFSDAAWRIAFRKAMITRVIGSIAKDNDAQLREMMNTQRLIGETLEDRGLAIENERRRGLGQAALVLPNRADEPDPAALSGPLVASMAAYARGLYVPSDVSLAKPDQILAVLKQRLRNARSKPQEFVAHEIAMLELQALVAASRTPKHAQAVQQLLAAAKLNIARADDVLEQMLLCESAMHEIWVLTLGGGS